MPLGHCHPSGIPPTFLPALHLQLHWRLHRRCIPLSALPRCGYVWNIQWFLSVCWWPWLLAPWCSSLPLFLSWFTDMSVHKQVTHTSPGPPIYLHLPQSFSFMPPQPPISVMTHLDIYHEKGHCSDTTILQLPLYHPRSPASGCPLQQCFTSSSSSTPTLSFLWINPSCFHFRPWPAHVAL